MVGVVVGVIAAELGGVAIYDTQKWQPITNRNVSHYDTHTYIQYIVHHKWVFSASGGDGNGVGNVRNGQ